MSSASHPIGSVDSIRLVLEWYRRRITLDRFGSRFPALPAPLAGWVVADPGEMSEEGGLRPLGAVRALLLELIATSALDERERFVVCARFGLTEYPAAQPARQLRHRLPMLRERTGDGVGERQLRHLTVTALRALDRGLAEAGQGRPSDRPVAAAPVDDPATAAWFSARVPEAAQRMVFERAVNAARVFAAIAGVDAEVARVLEEIDAYHADVVSGAWPPPVLRRGRSRARALVSLALWDLTRDSVPDIPVDPARTGIVREPSTSSVSIVSAPLGMFLAGNWSDEVVLQACTSVVELAKRDRAAAATACDLLLGGYGGRGKQRLSADAGAAVLRTAVRIRAHDVDPTAVALARQAYADRPRHWQTIATLQAAVKVASAYGCYDVADELCDLTDSILAEGFRVPVGRELEVERTEYRLFTHYQRTGTLRRRLSDGAGLSELERALAEQHAAERDYDLAYHNAETGAPNDVTDRWRFFLAVRAAELRLIVLQRRSSGRDLATRLDRIDPLLEGAWALAAQEQFGPVEYVPVIKVALTKALVEGDANHAVELLHELHRLGWPLDRTTPEIVAVSQPTLRRERAPHLLRDAVDEVAALEREPSWVGSAASTAGGWRRARARPLAA